MKFSTLPNALLALSLCALTGAAPNVNELKARAACNHDNVYRALAQNPSVATDFCGQFANIPTPTKFVTASNIKTFTVTTSTFTSEYDVYPNGRDLETYLFPSFLTSFSAVRVSSACTCVVTPATTTVTVSSSVEVSTTTVLSTSTLSGPCAPNTPYQGAYSLSSPGGGVLDFSGDFGEFLCCQICTGNSSAFKHCIGYIGGPRVCLLDVYGIDDRQNPQCPEGDFPVTFNVNPTSYPNNYGGPGPCAAKVSIVSTS